MKTNTNCLSRNTIALTFALLCFWLRTSSQAAQGLFLNERDFSEGKLSYSGCKIKIRDFSFKAKIRIKCDDTVHYLSKDSVYGYKDRNGAYYRFYKNAIYTLLDPDQAIPLYRIQVSGRTKYEPAYYSYYFGRDDSSAVYPLTISSLLQAFAGNKAFTDLIELRFRDDAELLEYDTYHEEYKLNRLLQLSKHQN